MQLTSLACGHTTVVTIVENVCNNVLAINLPLIWRTGLTISDSENEASLKCSFKNSVSFLLPQVFVSLGLTLSF